MTMISAAPASSPAPVAGRSEPGRRASVAQRTIEDRCRHSRGSGRTRAGQIVKRRADRPTSTDGADRRAPARADPRHEDRRGEGEDRQEQTQLAGQGVGAKNLADLHAPVLGDDRRRPAARAVPRHPRRKQEPTRRFAAAILTRSAATSRPARRWPTRCASTRTRSTRSSRNMVAAGEAGGILDTILKRLATYIEKSVKLKAQVQVGDGLPDRRPRASPPSSSASSSWKVIPTFAAAVRGPRRASCRSPTRDRHLAEQRSSSCVLPFMRRRRHRRAASASGATTRPTAAGMRRSTRRCCKLPILGDDPAQGRGGALLPDARRRCSAPACRFSTASTSPPRTAGNADHRGRDHGDARRASSAARRLPRRSRRRACSRRWSSQMIGVGESHGRARRRCWRRSPTSTRTKSTRPWPGC